MIKATGEGKTVTYSCNGDGLLYERTEGDKTTRHHGTLNDFLKKNGYTTGYPRDTFDMKKQLVYKDGRLIGEIHIGQPQ
ncbi:hypothetical protein [Paenibacillus xylanilyticus]|uniref:hypothetical protein n=1 Tax=Paenibacillus xylanilyticus TaxID=248903 RepID=UPI00399FEA46